MFNHCYSLSSLPDISKWNTINVKDMSLMFSYCSSLTLIPDISKWNTKNLKDTTVMFQNCLSLSFLPKMSYWDYIYDDDLFFDSPNIINIHQYNKYKKTFKNY